MEESLSSQQHPKVLSSILVEFRGLGLDEFPNEVSLMRKIHYQINFTLCSKFPNLPNQKMISKEHNMLQTIVKDL